MYLLSFLLAFLYISSSIISFSIPSWHFRHKRKVFMKWYDMEKKNRDSKEQKWSWCKSKPGGRQLGVVNQMVSSWVMIVNPLEKGLKVGIVKRSFHSRSSWPTTINYQFDGLWWSIWIRSNSNWIFSTLILW